MKTASTPDVCGAILIDQIPCLSVSRTAIKSFRLAQESKPVFIIEDGLHAEWQSGEFATFEDAMTELHRRANIPWDVEPNQAPCVSWKTCGRSYEIIEFDTTHSSWREIRRVLALNISVNGIEWLINPDQMTSS